MPSDYKAERSLRHEIFVPSYFTRYFNHFRVLLEAPLLASSTTGYAHGVQHVSNSGQST